MDRLIPIIVVIAAVASWWWFEQVLTGGRARSPLWMAFSMTAVSAVYLVSGLIGYTLDRHDRFVAHSLGGRCDLVGSRYRVLRLR